MQPNLESDFDEPVGPRYPWSIVVGSKRFEESTTSHQTLDGVRTDRTILVVWDGGMVQCELPRSGRIVFGRGQECDVQIDHTSVSRRHIALHVEDDVYVIEDLGSSNGTRVDGRKLGRGETVRLQAACPVRLGATRLILPVLKSALLEAATSAGAEPLAGEAGMNAVFAQVDLFARGKLALLVLGETGVGKEVVAREIHRRSPRAAGPFVRVSCASLSEALLESELFGYERGALPGATEAKEGLVEATDGGTLFLDEIGELSPPIQARLLRVLESGELTRIGSVRVQRVDVRFVAATNKDLEALVASGALRSDLYFRLAGATIGVPPLRERPLEIPTLARQFATAAGTEIGKPNVEVTQGALSALVRHAWPGNVRELKNVVERAVLLSRGGPIRPEHLALGTPATSPATSSASSSATTPSTTPAGDLRAQLSLAERDHILAVLTQCDGNQSRAAKVLGVSRRTLIARLEAHRLPRPRKRVEEP